MRVNEERPAAVEAGGPFLFTQSVRLEYGGEVSDNASLERAIAGALRAAIKDHGPITLAHVGSATKRIAGNLANAKLGTLAATDMARRRWSGTTEAERSDTMTAIAASGGSAAWASMTPAERSEEMKRRAAKRRKKV